ncbi:glutamine-hydrolyzing GMP synthase [Marinicella gelatinilytica]|uniref:glutamine-hydrolyzing GMP synthase n=1 Tax=Marinicella gelatinilytica TaxID=2996017 RepID=UPI0022608CE3|nr:glutamine-hydrolyzing GMP synthase [Marinicella gelatinilytica]MCX7544832.1 glutamine-hydrolyzing GMP synthase [Marinicella gelatinilytica]
MDIKQSKILIIDYGSQYTQLIARRVRELDVYCEIYAWDASAKDIRAYNPSGVILSGGPESVHLPDAPPLNTDILDLKVPILGICYGMQLLNVHFGGQVEASDFKEFGYAAVELMDASQLMAQVSGHQIDVWMSHGDQIKTLAPGFKVVAKTNTTDVAAFEHPEKQLFGLQFHPEVEHTDGGRDMLSQFVHGICGCEKLWKTDNIIATHVDNIRAQVGQDHVLLGLSGGVDSSVVAALLHEAIGEQLVCVFVDTGLLRFQEGDQVMKTMADKMDINVIRVNAQEQFFNALAGVNDPEQKRKVIGEQFIRIFEREAKQLNDIKWLAQGTIYPDVIESAASSTGKAHVIKSHHNVGGLPADLALDLIEPLRDLFKDEVRKLGVSLGLPPEMVYRHPFPGPGLGVRILGEVKPQYAEILARADHIFIEELRRHDLYDKTSQAFAVFLPIKSVGVVGDQRRYEYVIALRAVETIDFMTARWAHLPYDFIDLVSRRIINEIDSVSRVVYDISSKPPATIEWE